MIVGGVDSEYLFFLAFWLVAPILLFVVHARRSIYGGFLVYSYLLGMIMSHWFGALAHASPWSHLSDTSDTVVGFRYTSYGVLAFVAGTIASDLMRRVTPLLPSAERSDRINLVRLFELDRLATHLFVPVGIASWLATYTPVATLPSAAAILSVGKQCLLLGMCLMCWSAWHLGRWRRFVSILALSALLPVVTVVSSGFIGYGIVMVTTVLAFVAMFYRPRWPLLVGLLMMLYGGVSLWVVYAEHRNEIRGSVWGGESASESLDKVMVMLSDFQFFDPSNERHLDAVDLRLNQNYLVGVAVRTTPSLVAFRSGETIFAAVAAFIPRAIWPDKPVVAGSGNYVSEHTLIQFVEGTSVGLGQIMEFYINFGLVGIIGGMFVFGLVLRYLDIRLAEALLRGEWQTVMFVFLIGSAMLQVGGALSEVVASSAAGWVGSMLLFKLLERRLTGMSPNRQGRESF